MLRLPIKLTDGIIFMLKLTIVYVYCIVYLMCVGIYCYKQFFFHVLFHTGWFTILCMFKC